MREVSLKPQQNSRTNARRRRRSSTCWRRQPQRLEQHCLAHPPAAQEAFDFPVSLSLNLRYTYKTTLWVIRRIERDFLKTPAPVSKIQCISLKPPQNSGGKRAEEEQDIFAPPAPATKRRRLAHPPAAQDIYDFPVSLFLNLRYIPQAKHIIKHR